jgi:hypothetical protein
MSMPQPSFNIVKDLFDYIDMRKDGVLDIHEWMQSFRKLEVFYNKYNFILRAYGMIFS